MLFTLARMDGYISALLFSTLPFIGNLFGGLVAEFTKVSKRTLSMALHAAAGILIAVVGIELMPKALDANLPWVIILAFIGGGCFSILLDKFVTKVQSKFGQGSEQAGPWMIYLAVCVDLFSDGLMIGAGSTISSSLALILALGQVGGDFPEGFATIASLKAKGLTRGRRLIASVGFALPLVLGTSIGYWLVRGRPEVIKLALLSFTAAILVKAAVEEVIGEAHESGEDTYLQQLSFIGGFALFATVSSYLG